MSHQDPVTRLCISTVNLNTGLSFKIVHDLDGDVWESQSNRWIRKTKLHTPGSLIDWIKQRKPHCICVTKAQFDEITAGKSAPATKEEWEAENPSPPRLATPPPPAPVCRQKQRFSPPSPSTLFL